MATAWYYTQNGVKHGPVSAAELVELARSGKLQPTDLVRREGMEDWKPASHVKGLFPVATPADPPPTVAPPDLPPAATPPVATTTARGLLGALADTAKRAVAKLEAAARPPTPVTPAETGRESVPGPEGESPPQEPSLGLSTPPQLSRRTMIVTGIGGGVILLSCLVCGVIGLMVDTGGGEIEAKVTAESFVEKRLKAPASAEFPSRSEYKAAEIERNLWRVSGYVDAQNSFGAKLRSNWVVILRYEGKSQWTLISCDFAN